MSENKEEKENIYQKALGWVFVIWIVGFYPFFIFPQIGLDREMAGIFGDQFGVINTLFSGLAFAFFFYSLKFQREALEKQTEQITLQEKAIEKQTKSLNAQIEELKFQRKEYELSRNEQEKMNDALRVQNNTAILKSRLEYINDLFLTIDLYKEEATQSGVLNDIDRDYYYELKQRLIKDRRKHTYLFPNNFNPLFENVYNAQRELQNHYHENEVDDPIDPRIITKYDSAKEELELKTKTFIQESITSKNKTNSGDA